MAALAPQYFAYKCGPKTFYESYTMHEKAKTVVVGLFNMKNLIQVKPKAEGPNLNDFLKHYALYIDGVEESQIL